ncbi:DUF418 domain-containing protein [Pacificimonas flava]|uniref:Putative inner membrane protein n=1 Tax=Pacificimonas flava TaxID=1234595 RepID=M2T9G3_9SPHN|nr:DUF418 domain-containing protein [Pacificimonas flava]EMD83204.1 Putative inner membrane protein [Pacificimonas flava]MBB5279231.1 uncharacterized protein [Pacificimonas flava]
MPDAAGWDEEAPPPRAAPTRPAERLPLLDVLRGISICGILFLNIWLMGSVPGVETDPRIAGWSAADRFVWWVQMLFVEGTMRGLLEILFGAGFILLADKGMRAGRYYRRTALLILFGLVHGYLLLWPGDILLIYGLAGLFLWLLRDLEPRQMIGAGAAGIVMLTGLGLGATLGAANMQAFAEGAETQGAGEDNALVADWHAYLASLAPDAEEAAESRAARSGSLSDNWHYKVRWANELNDLGSTRIWLFEPLSMMLIGAALMRLGVLSGGGDRKVYLWMLAVGYGLGIPLNAAEWGQMAAAGFRVPIPMLAWSDPLSRTAVTIGHLGLLTLLWKGAAGTRLQRLFAPAGRMALTNYIGQTLICQWWLFPGFGLGLHGRLSIAQLWGVAAVILAVQLVASRLWLSRFAFGPLEWIWRWGTYGRRPHLLK